MRITQLNTQNALRSGCREQDLYVVISQWNQILPIMLALDRSLHDPTRDSDSIAWLIIFISQGPNTPYSNGEPEHCRSTITADIVT